MSSPYLTRDDKLTSSRGCFTVIAANPMTTTTTTLLWGSCLCGGVRYNFLYSRPVTGSSSQVAHCHCRDCQKFHGAAFSTFVTAPGLIWAGESHLHLKSYTLPHGAVRQFCSTCGSSLAFRGRDGTAHWEIAVATLDHHNHHDDNHNNVPQPDAHIFFSRKAPWLSEDWNHLPKFQQGRNSEMISGQAEGSG